MTLPKELYYQSVVYAHRKREEGYTLQEIGKVINKNHSCVIRYLKLYADLMQVDRRCIRIESEYSENEFLKSLNEHKCK